jgi:hypothetical protein
VLSLALVLALPALSATARAARDDGVHVDPNSAPASEYELPLDSARGVGAASTGGEASAGGGTAAVAPPPAFGSGITPRRTASSAGGTRRGRTATARRRGDDSDGGRVVAGEGAGAGLPTAASSGDGAGIPILYSLGGALVILAAGGLVALTLRRRQSPA